MSTNKQVTSTFKFGYLCLALKEETKVKWDHIKRFPVLDYLEAVFTSQTSMSSNNQVISKCNFGYHPLTLKEGPMVKSDHIRRFPAHDLLEVCLPSQNSKSKNKCVTSTFKPLFGLGGAQGQI